MNAYNKINSLVTIIFKEFFVKIIHFVQDISNESGGLKSALIGLNMAISKKNFSTIIYTFTKLDSIDQSVLREINGVSCKIRRPFI